MTLASGGFPIIQYLFKIWLSAGLEINFFVQEPSGD